MVTIWIYLVFKKTLPEALGLQEDEGPESSSQRLRMVIRVHSFTAASGKTEDRVGDGQGGGLGEFFYGLHFDAPFSVKPCEPPMSTLKIEELRERLVTGWKNFEKSWPPRTCFFADLRLRRGA